MKRYGVIIILLIFLLNGCGIIAVSDYRNDPSYYGVYEDRLNVLYLEDQHGHGVANVHYVCDSGEGYTEPDGAFYFYLGESCSFSLIARIVDSRYDDLFLRDRYGDGVRGVPYICENGGSGFTDGSGAFYYDNGGGFGEDICTFSL